MDLQAEKPRLRRRLDGSGEIAAPREGSRSPAGLLEGPSLVVYALIA